MRDRTLVTAEVIAKYLGCSTKTVYRMVKNEGLPAYRLTSSRNAHLCIRVSAMEGWINTRRPKMSEPVRTDSGGADGPLSDDVRK